MNPEERYIRKNMRLRYAAIAAALLVLAACAPNAKPAALSEDTRPAVELRTRIDRATAHPGDIITFSLEADYLPGVSLEVPEIADDLSDFRIVNSGLTQKEEGERIVAERWYKLQADISGSYVIEPIEVAYSLPDGKAEKAKTPKIFIEIESLLAQDGEAEDIRDIKPPVTISYPYRMFLLIAATLIGAILAVLAVKKLVEKLKQRAQAQRLARRPPHEEALEALEMLLKKGLIEKGRAREFCFEISEIFRRYMHARLDIPAIDLTTEEIIPRIEDNGLVDGSLKPLVKDFLVSTDLVKFAKHQPAREEMNGIIENMRAFINKTTIEPTAESEPAAGGDAR